MKKTLSLLLALMLLLSCIPAVAESVENPYEEYGVEILIDPATGEPYDLGGMVITVADWWSSDWHDNIGQAETAAAEATEEYRQWIEATYNFTIRDLAVTTWYDSPFDFSNMALTGTEENYVWILRPEVFLEPMNSGLFYDLATLDCLDFTEDKWNDAIREMTTKGDSIYTMHPSPSELYRGVFFNKRLLREAGVDPDSLYDMQANGTWTWAAFEELLTKLHRDTDNDGLIDRYAMMNFSSRLIPAAVVSNATSFVLCDENGLLYNAAETDAFLEAVNWIMDLVDKYEQPYPEGAEWNYFETAFINGECALQVHDGYFAGNLASGMEDEYGFVMFPKGPNADNCLWAPSESVMVIPSCYDAERAWKIAFAYNLYTNPTPGYEDSDAWKSGYYNNFCDDRAVDETLTMMRDTATQFIEYNGIVTGYDLGPQYIWAVYERSMTPAEAAEAMRGTWQALIDAANK